MSTRQVRSCETTLKSLLELGTRITSGCKTRGVEADPRWKGHTSRGISGFKIRINLLGYTFSREFSNRILSFSPGISLISRSTPTSRKYRAKVSKEHETTKVSASCAQIFDEVVGRTSLRAAE